MWQIHLNERAMPWQPAELTRQGSLLARLETITPPPPSTNTNSQWVDNPHFHAAAPPLLCLWTPIGLSTSSALTLSAPPCTPPLLWPCTPCPLPLTPALAAHMALWRNQAKWAKSNRGWAKSSIDGIATTNYFAIIILSHLFLSSPSMGSDSLCYV